MATGGRWNLTPRQDQILSLIVDDGLSYEAVAHHLGIANQTVRVHVVRIKKALGTSGRPIQRLIAQAILERDDGVV